MAEHDAPAEGAHRDDELEIFVAATDEICVRIAEFPIQNRQVFREGFERSSVDREDPVSGTQPGLLSEGSRLGHDMWTEIDKVVDIPAVR